ncbi:hypothetical protein ACJX0J_016391, partial [Zea mays]
SLADSICANRLENEAVVNIRGLSDLAKYRYISDASFWVQENIKHTTNVAVNGLHQGDPFELFFWQGMKTKKI